MYDAGLAGAKNGSLLKEVEAGGFKSFVTGDKQMENQQRLDGRRCSVILLSVTNWKVIRQHIAAISDAADHCAPGTLTKVYCGTLIPGKFRNPNGSG